MAGPPPSPTAGGGSSSGTVDVCTVLDAATAARLSGQPYTQAVPTNVEGSSACAYDNADATVLGVNVTVSTSGVDTTWDVVHTGNIAEISGLGDAAFWDNDNTLYAKAAGDLIQVNGLDSEDASKALAQVIVTALG